MKGNHSKLSLLVLIKITLAEPQCNFVAALQPVAQNLLLFQFRLKPIVRQCATAHWKVTDKGMDGT